VADSGNHRVQLFTADGRYCGDSYSYSYPSDVAFDAKNTLFYAADSNKHRVQVLSRNMSFCHLLGKKGRKTSLCRPCAVACSKTGKIYVTERDNNVVGIYEDKTFCRHRGFGYADLDSPYYIAVDDNSKRVYVSEWGGNRVCVFTLEGEYVSSFGKEGSEPGEFNFPRGLAVNDSGLLYVCDGENNRVQVFNVSIS
jgi:tripartite motif-containing protein 2/3/tripartite motif-containing protein 71